MIKMRRIESLPIPQDWDALRLHMIEHHGFATVSRNLSFCQLRSVHRAIHATENTNHTHGGY